MELIPSEWSLIEDYDGNFIYANIAGTHNVNINYTAKCEHPYTIEFVQLIGTFTMVGIEFGAYTAHACTVTDAKRKAYDMMVFFK